MYRVAVRRDFIAQHYLIGGDWGRKTNCIPTITCSSWNWRERRWISTITWWISSTSRAIWIAQIAYYRDRTLNERAEFKDTNPSLERFARLLMRDPI